MKNNKILCAILACTPIVFGFNTAAGENISVDGKYSVDVPYRLTVQVADDNFVFDPLTTSNRWERYFSDDNPHLAEFKETFTHWVGFHSINPNLVLALMEQQSGLLSQKAPGSLASPFAQLSDKQGFAEQLNDVLSRLAKSFYRVRHQQEQQFEAKGFVTLKQTAATMALEQLFAATGKPGKGKLKQLVKAYEQRFEHSLVADNNEFKSFSAAAFARPKLQLPWSLGYSWVGGGSHGYDGSSWPHSSLDFAYDWPNWGGQTWSVRSAHGGTVSVLSSCHVRVTDASGWATTYYHMANLNVYNGQQIGANTHLGFYASNKNQALCEGGTSTGPHLHFSLLRNGYYQSLDGVQLSNYEVNTGRYSYDSNCYYFNYRNWNNNGNTFCAWQSMYNYRPN